jgi:TetR/AcrR family transcriptional repressor of nem operon
MPRPSTREQIIEAGLRRFHSRGYNAAGVKDITDDAGVPKGSFYNHFDSKEALAIVALERYGNGLRIGDLTEPGSDPLARLRAHFEFLRDLVVKAGLARGCLFGNFGIEVADHSDTIRKAVNDGLHEWARHLAAAIAEAQAAGSVNAGADPAALARFLLNAWEGTLIDVRASQSAKPFDIFFTVAFGQLLR